MAQPALKEKGLDIYRDIGPAFSREALLIVHGKLDVLRREHPEKYSDMKPKEFKTLQQKTAEIQARMLALHDPEIDKALDRYEKKNKRDAEAVHRNIELALVSDLVKKAIQDVNKQNDDAKSYTRLLVEWRTLTALKDTAKLVLGIISAATNLSCSGEEVTNLTILTPKPGMPVPKEGPVPKTTREYAEAERAGLIGAELGENNPDSYLRRTPGETLRELTFSGEDLPLLRDQFTQGPRGEVLVTSRLAVRTRVLYNEDELKLSLRGFRTAAVIEFSDAIGVGSKFSILGREVTVVDTTNGLVIEDSKGKRYTIGFGDNKELLGMTNLDIRIVNDQTMGGIKAIVLVDKKNDILESDWLKNDNLLLFNTFGFHLDGLNLTDNDYTNIHLEHYTGNEQFIVEWPDGSLIEHKPDVHITATRPAFDINGNEISEFYIAHLASDQSGTSRAFVYRPFGELRYLLYTSTGSNPITYNSPGGESILVEPQGESGEPYRGIRFSENSGRPGYDSVMIMEDSAGYAATSRPPKEGGTLGLTGSSASPRNIDDLYITHRGSNIEVERPNSGSNPTGIDYWVADKVGNAVVRVTQ